MSCGCLLDCSIFTDFNWICEKLLVLLMLEYIEIRLKVFSNRIKTISFVRYLSELFVNTVDILLINSTPDSGVNFIQD